MSDLKPGQTVKCTVLALPNTDNRQQTVERLMRLDPSTKRSLRRAQTKRAQRMNVYIRGNRVWTSREHPAKVVDVKQGATWTMRYSVDLMADLASVKQFIKVEPA